ncbi:MAG: hypothetical protein J6Y29_00550 [Clostridiales bacterium]|nr:hypothetical protein [Clostridiales bacterium]
MLGAEKKPDPEPKKETEVTVKEDVERACAKKEERETRAFEEYIRGYVLNKRDTDPVNAYHLIESTC